MPGRTRSTATTLSVLTAAALATTSCATGHRAPAAAARATTTTISVPTLATTTTTETSLPATTTATTVDPGSLPQTDQLPSGRDPSFLARMASLLAAVSSGDTAAAAGAFFPLSAYIQVKGIADPVHDYQTRLIADYDQDIAALHARYAPDSAPVVLDHVAVPAAAQWILPGVEYNKGSYWRVYGTQLWFRSGRGLHDFVIASLISWRGQWYVVHLNSIR